MFAIKQKFMRLFCHEVIPIFWDDLTPQKQAELRQALGGNGNYDVFPIAEVPVPDEEEEYWFAKQRYRGAVAEKLPPRHTGGADQHERSLHEVEAR